MSGTLMRTAAGKPPLKPRGYEAAFGDYGPQFYEHGTPVLWGFKLLHQVGEAGFLALKAVGAWYYQRRDPPPGYYLITKQLTRQEAIAQYGAVTAEEYGAYGSWQATTFGTTRLACRSVRPVRLAGTA
jgi:hypothetical protein